MLDAAVAAQPVTESSYRLQRPYTKRAIDLFPQVANVDLDDVGSVLVPDVPSRIQQLMVTEHLSRASHEDLEQRKLTSRQPNFPLTPPDSARRRVESQGANLDHYLPVIRVATREDAQPGYEPRPTRPAPAYPGRYAALHESFMRLRAQYLASLAPLDRAALAHRAETR
jgi:hypothetical protein